MRGYVQGALRKRQLLDFFAEHFNGKSRKKNRFRFSSLMLLNLIEKGIVPFSLLYWPMCTMLYERGHW